MTDIPPLPAPGRFTARTLSSGKKVSIYQYMDLPGRYEVAYATFEAGAAQKMEFWDKLDALTAVSVLYDIYKREGAIDG